MREWRSPPFRSNCLFWAVRQWYRRGGYLVIRKARVNVPFWHFAWMSKRGRMYHFRPVKGGIQFGVWFQGYVSLGEDGL